MSHSDGLTVGASWVGVLGEGYGGPKDWITEHNTLPESDPQRQLRQRIYDLARWRALQLAARDNPGGVLAWYEEHIRDAGSEHPQNRNYRRLSPEERKRKVAELQRELSFLRPFIKNATADPARTNIWAYVNHLTFNILKGMAKYGHPIRPGQTSFDEADVWCAGGDELECPLGFPEGLEVDLTREDYEEHKRAQQAATQTHDDAPAEQRTAAGPPEYPVAVMPEPGSPEWDDLHARMLNVLAEVIWLTEFGGQTGDEQAGLEKTLAQPVEGQRNFYWFWRAFSNWRGPFSHAEFARRFSRQDGSTMLAIARDLLEFAQTGNWPRLARLRHEMYPGVELYRRSQISATGAGKALQDLRAMAARQMHQPVRELVRAAAGSHYLGQIMPPALPDQPASVVARVSRLVRETLQRYIAEHKQLSSDQKRAVRFIESGPVRRVGASVDTPVEGATFLVYNSRPGLFMREEPTTGLRFYDLMVLFTTAGPRGWRVLSGRRNVDFVVPIDTAQWDNPQPTGPFINVGFSELTELASFGPMLLSTTGPTPYVLHMMHLAIRAGRLLTPYGLYLRDRGLLHYDPATIPAPEVIAGGAWTTTVERAIFSSLGLAYEMPARRTQHAPQQAR